MGSTSINGGVKDVEHKQHVGVNVPDTSSFSRSFAAAVSNEARPYTIVKNIKDKLTMVIDDDCLLDKNSKLTLVGKVKTFDSSLNLCIIFNDEGFENVIISHEGMKKWFSDVQPWMTEFKVEERVLWVDVEGIPSVTCTNKTFTMITKRWGELLFIKDPDDSNLWRKRLCMVTKIVDFIMESFKIIIKGKVSVIRARKIIGWNPEFVEQEYETSSDSGDEESEKSTPFTGICSGVIGDVTSGREGKRDVDNNNNGDAEEEESEDIFVIAKENIVSGKEDGQANSKVPLQESTPVEKEQISECNMSYVKAGGGSDKDLSMPKGKCPRFASSLLDQMNEFVEIGQAMRFSMDGCVNDIEKLISRQGDGTCSNLLMIGVYAPQELSEKNSLELLAWGFRQIKRRGNSYGRFNEVRYPSERHGSVFNNQGAMLFNSFIESLNLRDIPLGGFSFTWAVRDASKMSKLDRFLVSDGLLCQFLALSGLILARHLSDHRPIFLRECDVDYGPIPFKTFHSWFSIEGFDQVVNDSWHNDVVVDPNKMDLWKELRDLESLREKDLVQKAKVKWAIEGDENSNEMFFSFGSFPKGCNTSFIDLIPKVNDAKFMKNFHPISLIGCQYKIVGKILANRLSLVIDGLVSKEQSAFIRGRQILDAYDSVRWDFLDMILSRFGFGDTWRGWIKGCLVSSTASIIVNGSPTQECFFQKGLRQRDPLSPFLFLLVMESLHVYFVRAMEGGFFKGIHVGSFEWIHISHIFYADDAIFIGEWKEENLCHLFRSNFLRGVDPGGRKASWFSWDRVVASKQVGGLGMSSFFAMNRALLFKWIWRFKALPEALWVSVIKAIHGPFEDRQGGGGAESMQLEDLSNKLSSLELVDEQDSWYWNLNGEGVFTVSSARRFIDDGICVLDGSPTKWGMEVSTMECPVCRVGNETSDHLFFSCSLASAMISRFFKWWELPDKVFIRTMDGKIG
ncbi:RNA-directed DNA polymerase, eukaryota [Tanacetum coccineum]